MNAIMSRAGLRAVSCVLTITLVLHLTVLRGSRTLAQEVGAIWESPTSGEPLSLEYAPPGAVCHVVVRPKAIWTSEEGQRALKALGPKFNQWASRWFQQRSLDPLKIAQLQISLVKSETGVLQVASVVRFVADGSLPTAWKLRTGANQSAESPAAYYHITGNDITGNDITANELAWVVSDTDGTVAVMGTPSIIGDGQALQVLANSPIPNSPIPKSPILRREAERLRKRTDADRWVTVLATPQFFRSKLRTFPHAVNEAMKIVKGLWDEDAQALCASLHVVDGQELFLELQLAAAYESQEALPQRIKLAVTQLTDSATSASQTDRLGALAARWPQMIKSLCRHTRIARDQEITIVAATLPGEAAHNLALGSSLFLQTPANRTASTQLGSAPGTDSLPGATQNDDELKTDHGLSSQALTKVLQHKIDFKFDQLSLEFALRDLQKLVRETVPGAAAFTIRLDGPALQDAGITRNQQIANFSESRRPLADVLTKIVKGADPSLAAAAKNQAPPASQLIWAAAALQETKAGQIILVTTASMSKKRGERIPRVFRNR